MEINFFTIRRRRRQSCCRGGRFRCGRHTRYFSKRKHNEFLVAL